MSVYKWGLHLVFWSVLRPNGRPDDQVARSFAKLFSSSQPDWNDLDLTKDQQAKAKSGLAQVSFDKAVALLTDTKFAFLQYNWIPAAVQMGKGPSLVSALKDLTSDVPVVANASDAGRAREWRNFGRWSHPTWSLGNQPVCYLNWLGGPPYVRVPARGIDQRRFGSARNVRPPWFRALNPCICRTHGQFGPLAADYSIRTAKCSHQMRLASLTKMVPASPAFVAPRPTRPSPLRSTATTDSKSSEKPGTLALIE